MAKFIPKSKGDNNTSNNVSDNKHLPETNIEVKALPSKSIPYPKDCVIKHRPYTFGEIKTIAQSKLNVKDKFDRVLKGIDTSFDKLDLTVPDLIYLAFLRKISTFGVTDLKISTKCPVCNGNVDFKISLEDFDFNELKAPKLPVIVPIKNEDYMFKPISIGKYFQLLDKKKEDDEIALMAMCCISKKFEDAYDYFYNAVPGEVIVLQEVDKYLDHGLKPIEEIADPKDSKKRIKLRCQNKVKGKLCNTKLSVELDGGQALMLPFRKHRESSGYGIRFGN